MAYAYPKKAAAPRIIERDSILAYSAPCLKSARPIVVTASDGAALKIPEKLLGLNRSPTRAKPEIITPPAMNRNSRSLNSKLSYPVERRLRAESDDG